MSKYQPKSDLKKSKIRPNSDILENKNVQTSTYLWCRWLACVQGRGNPRQNLNESAWYPCQVTYAI